MQFKKILVLSILLTSCSAKHAGFIPMHYDEFIDTTLERSFELETTLKGELLVFQPSYDCTNDSIYYNSTSLIRLESGDTITVYSPCLQKSFENGITVSVELINLNSKIIQQTKREIIQQFPKKHRNYPYWECITCKYRNTIGMVNAR